MDTLQLNRINELAREYLRLGIAKSTNDAVEKARFQLAFEKEKIEPETSPYESFFPESDGSSKPTQRSEPSPIDRKPPGVSQKDFSSALDERDQATRRAFAQQGERIEQLESQIRSLMQVVEALKSRPAPSAEPAPQSNPVARDGPIAEAIEQTIKGRTISADDVAVDKIFYFGNR